MVALVILGLVVIGFLEVFQGSTRLAQNSETWATAVGYAEDGMEIAKMNLVGSSHDVLPGGFERSVETHLWGTGSSSARFRVRLPAGGGWHSIGLVGFR